MKPTSMPVTVPSSAATASGEATTDVRHLAYFECLRRMSRTLSHELNGKLGLIALKLEVLSNDPDPNGRARRIAELREALSACTSQVKALTAALRPKVAEEGRFDWRAELAEQVLLLDACCAERRASLRLELPDHPVVVAADPDAVDQVVLSVAEWALAAAEAGAPPGSRSDKLAVTFTMTADDCAALSIRFRAHDPNLPVRPDGCEPVSFRVAGDVLARHGGQFQFTANSGEAHLRLELPLERKRT